MASKVGVIFRVRFITPSGFRLIAAVRQTVVISLSPLVRLVDLHDRGRRLLPSPEESQTRVWSHVNCRHGRGSARGRGAGNAHGKPLLRETYVLREVLAFDPDECLSVELGAQRADRGLELREGDERQ